MEQKRNSDAGSEIAIFTIPNLLSLFRLCLIPVIVWLYCAKKAHAAAGGVLLLSGATDIADGYIARRFHMTSNLGKILDPVADKLTQGAMLLCLLSRFPQVIFPVVLMAAKELFMIVTGILIIKKTGGTVFGANWHGKAATFLLYSTIFLHIFWDNISPVMSSLSLATCTLMIAISFILYSVRNINVLRGNHS